MQLKLAEVKRGRVKYDFLDLPIEKRNSHGYKPMPFNPREGVFLVEERYTDEEKYKIVNRLVKYE